MLLIFTMSFRVSDMIYYCKLIRERNVKIRKILCVSLCAFNEIYNIVDLLIKFLCKKNINRCDSGVCWPKLVWALGLQGQLDDEGDFVQYEKNTPL